MKQSKSEVEAALRRLLHGGPIERLPKKPDDADMLMALATASLQPQSSYSEFELNQHLKEWLADFTCPIGLDHVTFRRHLVDYSFLIRDAAGENYRANATLVARFLEPEACTVIPREVHRAVEADRAHRKRLHATTASTLRD